MARSSSPITFFGIDPTAGRHPYTLAALDQDCRLINFVSGELEDVLAFLSSHSNTTVAINAPPRPNLGLVKKRLEKQNLTPGQLRGLDLRLSEYELHERGITVSPTPSIIEQCPAWMQLGFSLYKELKDLKFEVYSRSSVTNQYLETHPFCVLLGQLPLPKPTLEGRLQRQLLLYELNVGIKDPMNFFEEITRHRLLKGILPVEFTYLPEELDALIAAYTAYLAVKKPENIIMIGDVQEGSIVLPMTELKEKY